MTKIGRRTFVGQSAKAGLGLATGLTILRNAASVRGAPANEKLVLCLVGVGRGTVLGTFLGVLILGVVQNGLELAGISSVWQTMLTGAILIVTAVVNQRVAGRRG